MFTIKAKKRDAKDSLTYIRKQGETPAVFYGLGKDTTPISIPSKEFQKIWKEAGESTTINLETDNGTVNTLIHDVAIDPLTGYPLHADFLVIDINKKISVSVPLEFEGIAPAVKEGIGTLVKVMHEIEIEALPKDLPHAVVVDISNLTGLDSQITVADLKLPTGVVAIAEREEVVAAISVMKEEKEEETTPVDLSAIEVEKKGKKEEEAPIEETA